MSEIIEIKKVVNGTKEIIQQFEYKNGLTFMRLKLRKIKK